MSRERKTLLQFAAEAGGGYECPRCGCADWRGEQNSSVDATRRPNGKSVTVRKRICRHCGQSRFVTQEIVVPEGYKAVAIPIDLPLK